MPLSHEEEMEAIERYYRSRVAGAPSDEEELAIARQLLEQAERGAVVNDAGSDVIVIRKPDLPVDADFLVDHDAVRRQELRRILPIVAGVLVALAAVLITYGDWGKGTAPTPTVTAPIVLATTATTPTVTPTPSPSPSPTATPIPSATPTPTPLAPEEVRVRPEPVKLEEGAVVPVSLEIAGRYFPVVATTLRDEAWAYDTEPNRVSWLAGSYVNVVLGLPYSAENDELLSTTLALSDTITLRNSVAGVNYYTVVERRSVSVYEIEALNQRRAGLTLVLLGGHAEAPDGGVERRLVIRATLAEADGEEVITSQEP